MPNDDLVVSDTSPLLNLSLIGRLDLLKAQFSSITAPNHVWAELTDGDAGVDALIALRDGGFLSIVEMKNRNYSPKSVTSWIVVKQPQSVTPSNRTLISSSSTRVTAVALLADTTSP
jgi:Predicted nucleic acid-binding protein, contains PIN domain